MNRTLIIAAVGLTIAIELATVIARFGLNMEATRDTASLVGTFTQGIRIHHGYVGVVLIAVAWLSWSAWPPLPHWLLVVGVALLASDLIHHFLVLWPLTGHHHFDLTYR